jgi:hypothetical protein
MTQHSLVLTPDLSSSYLGTTPRQQLQLRSNSLEGPRTQADLQKDNYRYGKKKVLTAHVEDLKCKEQTKIARTETGNASMLEHIHRRTGSPLPDRTERYHLRRTFVCNLDIPTFQQATTKWQVLIVLLPPALELAELQESS